MRSTSHPTDMWTFMIRTAYHWALHFWHMTYTTKTSGSALSDKNITHQFHNFMSWCSLPGHTHRQERNTIPTCTSTCGFTVNSSGWWWKITQEEDMSDVLRRIDKRLQMHWKSGTHRPLEASDSTSWSSTTTENNITDNFTRIKYQFARPRTPGLWVCRRATNTS